MTEMMSAINFRPDRFYSPQSAKQRAAVAVSACLAGEKVRYDGADKLNPAYPLLAAELHLVPVCPEYEAGLGIPRPPVQLVRVDGNIKALGRNDRALDVTSALQTFAERSLPQLLNTHQLCGYLWKSRSPSCGFNSTPIFDENGDEIGRGSGIQAACFQHHLPHLSYCEETALHTENDIAIFILRCRLVFDVLYAAAASLTALHQHYSYVHENFDDSIAGNLRALSVAGHRTDYLTTLLSGCRQISQDKLLGFFIG